MSSIKPVTTAYVAAYAYVGECSYCHKMPEDHGIGGRCLLYPGKPWPVQDGITPMYQGGTRQAVFLDANDRNAVPGGRVLDYLRTTTPPTTLPDPSEGIKTGKPGK